MTTWISSAFAAAMLLCCAGAIHGALLPDAVHTLPGAVIDPAFAWYSGRSDESIAEELKSYGYKSVRYIAVRGSEARLELVKRLHAAGLPVTLETFGNGVYSTADLPKGWESWKMRLREGEQSGYTYLCLNEPAYRAWKKRELVDAVKRCGFDAVEIAEPFWPAHGGPEKASYGCLCQRCIERFRREAGMEAPEFTDATSDRYWKTDAKRYARWVDARSAWLTEFLNDIINGADGLRKKCPEVKALTWSIASRGASPEVMREWEGADGGAIARTVRPDGHVVQTDWPDWLDAELPADYVLKYAPYVAQVRAERPTTPVLIQTDLGSERKMLRSDDWMRECQQAAVKPGAVGVFGYMHSLQKSIYTDPIRMLACKDMRDTVRIVLNKWAAPEITKLENWTAQGARVASVVRDGCTLVVKMEERRAGAAVRLSWKRVTDDPSKRWFKDVADPCPWKGPSEVLLSRTGAATERQ